MTRAMGTETVHQSFGFSVRSMAFKEDLHIGSIYSLGCLGGVFRITYQSKVSKQLNHDVVL